MHNVLNSIIYGFKTTCNYWNLSFWRLSLEWGIFFSECAFPSKHLSSIWIKGSLEHLRKSLFKLVLNGQFIRQFIFNQKISFFPKPDSLKVTLEQILKKWVSKHCCSVPRVVYIGDSQLVSGFLASLVPSVLDFWNINLRTCWLSCSLMCLDFLMTQLTWYVNFSGSQYSTYPNTYRMCVFWSFLVGEVLRKIERDKSICGLETVACRKRLVLTIQHCLLSQLSM